METDNFKQKFRSDINKCVICLERYVSYEYMIGHIVNDHLRYTLFKCRHENCGAEFGNEKLFERHCVLKHAGRKLCLVDCRLSDIQIFQIRHALFRSDVYNSALLLPLSQFQLSCKFVFHLFVAILLFNKRIVNVCERVAFEFSNERDKEPSIRRIYTPKIHESRNIDSGERAGSEFLNEFSESENIDTNELTDSESANYCSKDQTDQQPLLICKSYELENCEPRNLDLNECIQSDAANESEFYRQPLACRKNESQIHESKSKRKEYDVSNEFNEPEYDDLQPNDESGNCELRNIDLKEQRTQSVSAKDCERDQQPLSCRNDESENFESRNIDLSERVHIEPTNKRVESECDQQPFSCRNYELQDFEPVVILERLSKAQLRKIATGRFIEPKKEILDDDKQTLKTNGISKSIIYDNAKVDRNESTKRSFSKSKVGDNVKSAHKFLDKILAKGPIQLKKTNTEATKRSFSATKKDDDIIPAKKFLDKNLTLETTDGESQGVAFEMTKRSSRSMTKKESCNVVVPKLDDSKLSDSRIQCMICDKRLANLFQSIQSHLIVHLNKDENVARRFICLLCSETTNYGTNMRSHLIKSHGLKFSSTCGVHYKDRKTAFNEEMDKIQSIAFPDLVKTKNPNLFQEESLKVDNPNPSQNDRTELEENANQSKDEEKCEKKFIATEKSSSDKLMETNHLRCNLCNKWCFHSAKSKRYHSVSHLNTDSNVGWLFRCLLCAKTTLYQNSMRSHLGDSHHLAYGSMMRGVHYDEQISQYEKELERIQIAAFSKETKGDSQVKPITTCSVLEPEVVIIWSSMSTVPKHVKTELMECSVSENPEITTKLSSKSSVQKQVKAELLKSESLKKPKVNTDKSSSKNSVRKSAIAPHGTVVCQICKSNLQLSYFRRHISLHLPDQAGIDWIYSCSICDNYRCLSKDAICKHAQNKHGMKYRSVDENVHYASRYSQFESEIARVRSLAFGKINGLKSAVKDSSISKRSKSVRFRKLVSTQSRRSNHYQQCQLCDEKVNFYAQIITRHVSAHVAEKNGITRLYECSMCHEYRHLRLDSVKSHIDNVHGLKPHFCKENEHYTS